MAKGRAGQRHLDWLRGQPLDVTTNVAFACYANRALADFLLSLIHI